MERIVTSFPEGSGARRIVVCCYQTFLLQSPRAVPSDTTPDLEGLPARLREIALSPPKQWAEVVLLGPSTPNSPQAWVAPSLEDEPRQITDTLQEPLGGARLQLLLDAGAESFARAGGLTVASFVHDGWGTRVAVDVPPYLPASYFNVAPPHQQLVALTGAEVVWIVREEGRSWSQLPSPVVQAWATDVMPHERLEMRLDTLVLGPDEGKAVLFWRGALQRPDRAPTLETRLSLQAPPLQGSAQEASQAPPGPDAAPARPHRKRQETIDLAEGFQGAMGPLFPKPGKPAGDPDDGPTERRRRSLTPALDALDVRDIAGLTLVEQTPPGGSPALPFRSDRPAAPSRPAEARSPSGLPFDSSPPTSASAASAIPP
ncbi:MAG: DUF2169 domain-containing protein, partial [Myxococcales bacterium]|nr:DUF2169 domain-containing protein [Myxococcales bacterium]